MTAYGKTINFHSNDTMVTRGRCVTAYVIWDIKTRSPCINCNGTWRITSDALAFAEFYNNSSAYRFPGQEFVLRSVQYDLKRSQSGRHFFFGVCSRSRDARAPSFFCSPIAHASPKSATVLRQVCRDVATPSAETHACEFGHATVWRTQETSDRQLERSLFRDDRPARLIRQAGPELWWRGW